MAAAMCCNHALRALSVDVFAQRQQHLRRRRCGNLTTRRRFQGVPPRVIQADAAAAAVAFRNGSSLWRQQPLGLAGSGKLRRGLQILCLRDSSREEATTSVSAEGAEETNGRGGSSKTKHSSSGEVNGNGHAGAHENSLPQAIIEVAQNTIEVAQNTIENTIEVAQNTIENTIEAAQNTTEVLAETLEVAATAVSVVGELDPVMPTEDDPAIVEQDAAVRTVVLWVSAAIGFGTLLFFNQGSGKASEFFAGYLLEQSLSVDNLFVFVVIFNYFKTPVEYQGRVLTYGIAGAVFFRAFMITLGAATLQRFEAINLFFASILLFSAYKLFVDSEDDEEDLSDNFIVNLCKRFIPVTSTYDGHNFFTMEDGLRKATPLLLTLAVVELSDVAFAVDSIPAVFGVTRDPLIVFSSNMFAILGLRSLYTLISGSMAELEYLQPCVAAVLGFIGCKMVLEYFGFHISTELSLGVVAACLSLGVGLSILAPTKDEEEEEEEM